MTSPNTAASEPTGGAAAAPTPPATGTPVTITKAKGRPMLTWVGKRPLTQLTAFPAQHIETYDPAAALAKGAARP